MQVSFYGLSTSIKTGREAVRKVKEEYPGGFVSNSRYDTFSDRPNPVISKKLADLTVKMRDIVGFNKKEGLDCYKSVEDAVRKTGVANCGEQAILVSNQLNKQGIKNKIITVSVYEDINNTMYEKNNHTFCLIDFDDDADILKPETWGENAVIVDMWFGAVDKAAELTKKYPDMLGYDKKKDKLIFHSAYI